MKKSLSFSHPTSPMASEEISSEIMLSLRPFWIRFSTIALRSIKREIATGSKIENGRG